MRKESEVLEQLIQWAGKHELIRAVILTSSRTNPKAPVDLFSDYDPVLVVTDTEVFAKDDRWLELFGSILTSFKDEFISDGIKHYTRLVLYHDGVKIDFSIWPVELLEQILKRPELPDFLDLGYRVLLDKDGLTKGLKPPTHSAYAISKPTKEEYLGQIQEFWWDVTYVAKSLWRDELFFAKYMLDCSIRFSSLQKMVEWYIGLKNDWAVNPGKYGRWFKRYLDRRTWSELEKTFTGSRIEDNWETLFKTTKLFRRLAIEVGEGLGYTYPHQLDERVSEYLLKVRNLGRDADDFD
ncbi:aminoglycoside 6-adenylyltransferase [Kosmotoga pacifica]|uniref:Aminoglycoside adenylyltransferase n=1 Tax=Kosmotoga pacifica TaxID=1330330 RepID=A0A0G2ZCW0_9BACT|nr:aminoglycoside 6-adenylyltransferase [Kosmotoga pacifica]AKI97404.1 hypothetical protein IX53_05765 [Kosmotoga pacifica]